MIGSMASRGFVQIGSFAVEPAYAGLGVGDDGSERLLQFGERIVKLAWPFVRHANRSSRPAPSRPGGDRHQHFLADHPTQAGGGTADTHVGDFRKRMHVGYRDNHKEVAQQRGEEAARGTPE
jgi:hypothetical protein